MIKSKKYGVLINTVLFVSFLFIATTKAEAQPDFMKGLSALNGMMDQLKKAGKNIQETNTPNPISAPTVPSTDTRPNKPESDSSSAKPAVSNADEFCKALETNPLITEYVSVLAKAVKTRAPEYNDAVFTATVLQFDDQYGQLRKWVEPAYSKPAKGEDWFAGKTQFAWKISDWASLCAAKNNSTDLFLLFVSDLREPERIDVLRAKAKAALAAYGNGESTITRTRLDPKGLPVSETIQSGKRLNFSVTEDAKLDLSGPTGATLAAFALPNGLTALDSVGKGKAQALSKLIDEAAAANEKAKTQEAALQEQKSAMSPNILLQQAYQAMQSIQVCSDVRKGYAAIYISDAELADAKEKMYKIENVLKPKITGETTDQIWRRASTENANYVRGVQTAQYTNGRNYCDLFKRDMAGISEKVLGKEVLQRDF